MNLLEDAPVRVESFPHHDRDHHRDRALPWLLVLFIGSGCAALIFEVVWLQLLQLVIGSSAVSLGVLLGTFMGGMCLGSLLLPRLVSARLHPLRVYAFLELGIGALGLAMLWLVPQVGKLYSEQVGHGMPGILLRGAVCAVCLLPPTFLMGATLPALARWTESSPRGIAWMGFFYGANIAGAVAGCLIAGFYLLRVYDVMIASYAAASLNLAVALGGFILSFYSPYVPTRSSRDEAEDAAIPPEPRAWTPYVTIALSGSCAMAAQVVWTRQLSLLIGATVYTFSITLAVFLVGLGIGSSLGSSIARSSKRPRMLLGASQFLAAAGIAWSAYMLSVSLPNWPVNPTLSVSPWLDFQLDIVRCTWAVLPPTILWGASFPLALAAAVRRGQDSAKLVGGVYAANTVGAIVGSLAASMLMVSLLGSQNTQRILIGLSAFAGIIAFAPITRGSRSADSESHRESQIDPRTSIIALIGFLVIIAFPVTRFFRSTSAVDPSQSLRQRVAQSIEPIDIVAAAAFSALILLIPGLVTQGGGIRRVGAFARVATLVVFIATGAVFASILVWKVPLRNDLLIAHGRSLPVYRNIASVVYAKEGMNSSVAVTDDGVGRYFHVSGKVEASTLPQDMRLQRMLGHIPAMLHKKPKSVLIVGCGAGVTAGSFIVHPDVERIVLCEIEPLIPKVVSTHFSKQNHDLINNEGRKNKPHLEIVYDDARHYMATTRETFDIITSDPIHPWVKGSATLYSLEYLELCKQRLNPGGIVTQWVPLYQSTEAVVKSELATFFKVFPEGTIFGNDSDGQGYDVVLLGQREPAKFDLDEIQARLERPEYSRAAEALREVGFRTGLTLLGTYAGYAPELKEYLKDAEINRDQSLRLQYLAGFGLNLYREDDIYKTILTHRKPPDNLLTGSDELRFSLKQLLGFHGIDP